MKTKWLLTFSFLIVFFVAGATNGLPPAIVENDIKKSDVAGGVFDIESKKPLGNVNVTAYMNNKKDKVVVTNLQGSFSFDDLKVGTYKFVFEKEGYKKVTKERTITRVDEDVELNIHMEEHNAFDFMPGPFSLIDFDE